MEELVNDGSGAAIMEPSVTDGLNAPRPVAKSTSVSPAARGFPLLVIEVEFPETRSAAAWPDPDALAVKTDGFAESTGMTSGVLAFPLIAILTEVEVLLETS